MSTSGRLTDDNPEVHVFSLKGKPIARYQVADNRRFKDFAVDEEEQNIFFLNNVDDGFPQVTRYSVSN